jgi:hypothetical protein
MMFGYGFSVGFEILRKIPEYLGLHSGIYNDTKNSINSQGSWGKADIDKHYQVLGCTKDNSALASATA